MRRLAGLSSRQRLLFGGAALGGAAVVVILLVIVIAQTSAADEQPIAFNHSIHAVNGIQCQFCHTGVAKGPVASIPSVEKCMGCHEYIATDSPQIQKLHGYWERQEPIPWKRVNEQPSFVYFNHASHIAAAVSCGACHGAVEEMTVAEPVVTMNMGFCLDCHAQQENKDALWDCAVCHR
ncbi:MAG: cytochrome c family protein [Anaerolineae bacterium]|nr:cytochrome c family protein [Anaerolineae bacterium]